MKTYFCHFGGIDIRDVAESRIGSFWDTGAMNHYNLDLEQVVAIQAEGIKFLERLNEIASAHAKGKGKG